MKSLVSLLTLLVLFPLAVSKAPARARTRPSPVRTCGAEDEPDAGKVEDVAYAGIVPGRGLSAEDFEGDGLEIIADPTLYEITDDPIGVLTRAAHNWEIPGTMIRFHVSDGSGVSSGNVVHAMEMKQAARATVGRPGWGKRGSLDMSLDVPFSRGDDALVAVVTHEMGHWLGFDHSFLGSTIMFPVLTDHINWVDPDQVAKAVARYAVGPNALGEVRGTVTRAGRPLSGARVNLFSANDRTAFATFAGSDGVFHVPVFAGTYRAVVDPNDGPGVAGNFIGTYPGGPLDFATLEVPGELVVSAGDSRTLDVDVPTGGDVGFKITTSEPTVSSPGSGAQGVTIYYEGARPSEIAAVEPLCSDLHVTNVTDTGGQLDVFVDVDRDALPGPRAFRVRKTNGAVAVVTGLVGVVGQFWIDAPAYELQAATGEPVVVSWIDGLPRAASASVAVSVSVDGGASWQDVDRVDPGLVSSVSWTPDAGLTTSALRVRARALDEIGAEIAIDESIFNIGLGRPARGAISSGVDTTAPTVAVLSPNGGETLVAGEPARIRWQADDDTGIASQLVEVSEDGGQKWTSLGEVSATARGLDWTPASKRSDAVLVRVTARDLAGNAAVDASDASASVRDRPEVTKVAVKTKGDDVRLKVKGTGFAAGASVVVNGHVVELATVVNGAGTSLTLRGTTEALHLDPTGQQNTIVVTVGGLTSAAFDF